MCHRMRWVKLDCGHAMYSDYGYCDNNPIVADAGWVRSYNPESCRSWKWVEISTIGWCNRPACIAQLGWHDEDDDMDAFYDEWDKLGALGEEILGEIRGTMDEAGDMRRIQMIFGNFS